MGTTEKPTGRAEPAGHLHLLGEPSTPGQAQPSTGDTRTLTWGQGVKTGRPESQPS